MAEGLDQLDEYPAADVINPWADVAARKRQFPDWDRFGAADLEAIRKATLPLGRDQHRFILWLPLRRPRQFLHGGNTLDPLVKHFPESKDLAEHLANARSFGGLLPTLASLREIRCVIAGIDGANATLLGEARLETGAATLIRPQQRAESRRSPLRGQVRLQSLAGAGNLAFAGLHEIADDPELARIAASERWPTIHAFDEQGLEQRAIRDKAHAQGAAFLIDMPAADGRARLEIAWAVFLPTGDESAEELLLEEAVADRSLRLVLHGYFFLDAGRQTIEALDEAGCEEARLADDATVRRSWNRALRDRVVLPMVPEAIDRARRLMKLSRQVVGAVCHALRRSELFRRHASAIGSRSSLVLVADQAQTGWQLLAAATRVLPIVPPQEADRGRNWRVLPGLCDLGADTVVSPAAAPNLRIGAPHDPWPDDRLAKRLAKVLRSISPASVMRRAEADHMVQFLETAAPVSPLAAATAEALEDLLRRALLEESVGVGHLRAAARQVRDLVSRLRPDRIHTVPARAGRPGVIARLGAVPGAPLILPADLAPPDHADAAPLPTTVVALLGALHDLVDAGDNEDVEAASLAASTLIKRAPRPFPEEVRNLRVLRAYDWRKGNFVPCSWADLEATRAKGLLFEWAVAQPVQKLQAVLPGRSVLSVEKAPTAPPCRPTAGDRP